LQKINSAIQLETGSTVSQSGNTFTITRGQVQANTNFPISFNVATKTFTVQTPSGQQQVSVMPDEALQKLFQSSTISHLQTGQNNQSPTVQLTQINNQPVYQVQGVSQKRFLGFLPVFIQKTAFLSAQSGSLVSTNESFFSKILDSISF